MDQPVSYDYIIAGAGCAGLSLLLHMMSSGKLSDRKILLIDRAPKNQNDRTWCFWETEPGLFEPIVYHRWDKAWVHDTDYSRLLPLPPYTYKLIRGIDFYSYCFERIRQWPNVQVQFGDVQEMGNANGKAWLALNGQRYQSDYLFNSIRVEKPVIDEKTYYLLQHFKGWVIETDEPAFDPSAATLMDFRTSQQQGTTFVYVMPFSTTRALIEYTLFTQALLEQSQYDQGLKDYLQRILKIGNYRILEEEFGVIPMTNHRFPSADGRIIHIGTAGGQTKASSGYTFRFIQKHSARIVNNLIKRNNPFIPLPGGPRRFKFYDSTLLHVLTHNRVPGHRIFTTLFKKNKPQQVLRFLDNESSLADELKIISSLPTLPFLKAAWKQR